MGDASEDIIKILRIDDISRKTQFSQTIHHVPGISGSGGDDKVGLKGGDLFEIETDITSHSNFALGLFRKVAMDGDAHDLFIEAEAEENFGDIGSQGNDPFRRKREDSLLFPLHL